jgi:hypothetical protein
VIIDRKRDLLKSRRVLRQPAELPFRFIADHADPWPVRWMCDTRRCRPAGTTPGPPGPPSAEAWRQERVVMIEQVDAGVKGRYRQSAEGPPR